MRGKNEKLIFLIIVVAVVSFSGRSYPVVSFRTLESPRRQPVHEERVPLFELQPTSNLFSETLKTQANVLGSITHASTTVQLQEVPAASSTSSVAPQEQKQTLPHVNAREALLADIEFAHPFFALSAKGVWPLASLTKLMTAVVTAHLLDLSKPIVLEKGDFSVPSGHDYLQPGEEYSTLDLLKAMLSFSSNEAANAIARSYGREQFVTAMNAQASAWSLLNTHFDDPAGLSNASRSTPEDVVRLVQHIYMEHPEILVISRESQWELHERTTNETRTVLSINEFAGTEGFIGGKTGYTDTARGNLVSVFAHGIRPIVVVVMGTDDRFGDTRKLLTWFTVNHT